MQNSIICPNCSAPVKVNLQGILSGDRPECPKCHSGIVINSRGEIIPPSPEDFFISTENKISHKSNFFIFRHWRGELSLPVSYWLISFLANIVSFIVVGIATKYFEAFKYFYPIGIWIGFVVMWGLIITIAIWQIVGLWRSAKNYQKRNAFNKKYYFGSLAKVAVFFGAMQFVVVAESAIPQFKEISSIAFDGDPTIPSYKLSIT